MLVPFPIAFFVVTLACDIAFGSTANAAFATASTWLLGAGLVMAALAAVAGLVDVAGERRIRELNDVWWHAGDNVVVVVLQAASFYLRYSQGNGAIVPTGIILSLIVVGILLFTGWKGWNMVYRHRVGVSDDASSATQPSAQPAQRRAA